MADDVLSQSEIDKLLAAFSTGEVSADEMKAEEEQKKVNTRAAERKLRLLLNANFGYGD